MSNDTITSIDLSVLKDWFSTGKKPTQGQFHGLLDSYYHKKGLIPMNGINGLSATLGNKADLVNGVVPESQLPFTVNTNEVISLGSITIAGGNVNIGVNASSGFNKVRINGQVLTSSFPSNLPYASVSEGNKFLRVVARNEPGLFFLKEGDEGDNPQEPGLDVGELHVRLILLTPEGAVVDAETLNGFKEKSEDNWKKITYVKGSSFNVQYTDKRQKFYLTPGLRAMNGTTNLTGISFAEEITRDLEFLIFNNSNFPIEITADLSRKLIKGFSSNFSLKAQQHIFVKYDHSVDSLDVIKLGGNASDLFIDGSLQGNSTAVSPLGLSSAKNDEIAGKITKPVENIVSPTLDYKLVPLLNEDGDAMQMDISSYLDNNYYTKTQIATLGYITTTTLNSGLATKLDKATTTVQQINGSVGFGLFPVEKVDVAGRVKANSFVLGNNIGIALPNELGRKDGFMCYADSNGELRYLSASKQFFYTPSSNFLTSQLKTALQASGILFHDADIIINLEANNYTCSIDNGADNLYARIFLSKAGNGSLSFTSIRALNAGSDNITIMNGNEGSMTKITFGKSQDILTVKNL